MIRSYGVHTFSAGMVLTHKEFKEVKHACKKSGCSLDTSDPWDNIEQLFCYAYLEQGMKVFLYGEPGKLYRIRVQVEPCRVLGDADPTALAKLGKRQYKELVKTVDSMLKKLKVPISIDKMKISRCDLTMNIEFSSQDELMTYLRIFQKSRLIPKYSHVFFKKNDHKVKDYKAANNHSHCISCKSASFLIYDKIAQLEMIDRCDETLMGKHVLRFEAELKRTPLEKHLGSQAMDTSYKLLSTAAKESKRVIRWYLSRMQPPCEKYLRYEDAVCVVEDASLKEKTRNRMLYLLRKTSDKESLTAALDALKEKYHLTAGQCKTVLKKFRQLRLSPITLTNASNFDSLPYILP